MTAKQITHKVVCNLSSPISSDFVDAFLESAYGKKMIKFVQSCIKELKPTAEQIESGKLAKAISDAIIAENPDYVAEIKKAFAFYVKQKQVRATLEKEMGISIKKFEFKR